MGKTFSTGLLTNGVFQDASNNIGIGAAPSGTYKLEVTGTAKVSSTLLLGGALSGTSATFSSSVTATSESSLFKEGFIVKATTTSGGGSQPAYTYYTAAGSKRWSSFLDVGSDKFFIANAANSELFTIQQNGNVGIGTSSPANKLQVNSTSGDGMFLTSYLTTSGAADTGAILGFGIYDGVNNRDAAIIKGLKENGTSGNYAAYLSFSTRPDGGSVTERMRITSGGSVGVGVTPKTYASTWVGFQVGNFSLMSPAPSTDANAILGANVYRATDNTWKRIIEGYGNLIEFNQGSGDIRTYTGGTSTADSTVSFVSGPFLLNGGVSWTNGSSDIRKKKNFETSQGLAELLQIEAVKYHFNWDEDNAKKRLGFKAQNLQNLIPEMVCETGEIAEDGSPYLTITPDYILPVLVKAIQEQQAIITSLQDRLDKAGL